MTNWQSHFYEDQFSGSHQKKPESVKLGEAMGVQSDASLLEMIIDRKVWDKFSPSADFFADIFRFPCFLWSREV